MSATEQPIDINSHHNHLAPPTTPTPLPMLSSSFELPKTSEYPPRLNTANLGKRTLEDDSDEEPHSANSGFATPRTPGGPRTRKKSNLLGKRKPSLHAINKIAATLFSPKASSLKSPVGPPDDYLLSPRKLQERYILSRRMAYKNGNVPLTSVKSGHARDILEEEKDRLRGLRIEEERLGQKERRNKVVCRLRGVDFDAFADDRGIVRRRSARLAKKLFPDDPAQTQEFKISTPMDVFPKQDEPEMYASNAIFIPPDLQIGTAFLVEGCDPPLVQVPINLLDNSESPAPSVPSSPLTTSEIEFDMRAQTPPPRAIPYSPLTPAGSISTPSLPGTPGTPLMTPSKPASARRHSLRNSAKKKEKDKEKDLRIKKERLKFWGVETFNWENSVPNVPESPIAQEFSEKDKEPPETKTGGLRGRLATLAKALESRKQQFKAKGRRTSFEFTPIADRDEKWKDEVTRKTWERSQLARYWDAMRRRNLVYCERTNARMNLGNKLNICSEVNSDLDLDPSQCILPPGYLETDDTASISSTSSSMTSSSVIYPHLDKNFEPVSAPLEDFYQLDPLIKPLYHNAAEPVLCGTIITLQTENQVMRDRRLQALFANANNIVKHTFERVGMHLSLLTALEDFFSIDIFTDQSGVVRAVSEFIFMRKYLYVDKLCVRQDLQNRSIGQMMMTRLMLLAQARDKDAILLFALKESERFYLRLGFERTEEWKSSEQDIGHIMRYNLK